MASRLSESNRMNRLEEVDLDPSENIDHEHHTSPVNLNSWKHVMKIPIFDSATLEEWIVFVDLI